MGILMSIRSFSCLVALFVAIPGTIAADEKERVVQALILNQYRQELATQQNINLKPVILFKAKQTIKESEQNKQNFHQLVESLNGNSIDTIRETSTVTIVQKAFLFFDAIHL